MSKIVHLGHWDKFLPPFIDFVEQHFDMSQHEFYFFGKIDKYPTSPRANLHLSDDLRLFDITTIYPLVNSLNNADKIILHGLFNSNIIKLLWLMPWLLKKCYWGMWGADLYAYEYRKKRLVKEFFRRSVIKNLGYILTYIKGDYALAQQWYGTKAQYQECFMYPSNLYKDASICKEKISSSINILVGNSADKSNNHLDVFQRLSQFSQENIRVYVPLSYGGKPEYVTQVIAEGKKLLGERVIPLTDMLPFDQYLALLAEIDIAIFNHNRQQAMGNIISLLSFGKKVFLRSDVTHWNFFQDQHIIVNDIESLDLLPLTEAEKEANLQKIKLFFSESNFIHQLNELFQ